MIFQPTELDRAIIYLKSLFAKGKKAKIDPIKGIKTLSQNNYSWLVFTHVGQESGNSKEDIYEHCLEKFPTFKEITINGVSHLIRVTMSNFSKEQMSVFIDNFTIYWRTEGYFVPDPEDKKCMEMYQYYRDRGLL